MAMEDAPTEAKPEPIIPHTTYPGTIQPTHDEQIEGRILHLLSVYPRISPSMIQIGIGSNIPANWWKPVLRSLIERKIITEDIECHATTTGRLQTYVILSLA